MSMTLQKNSLPEKKILVFGAGKSTTCLIDYLLKQAADHNWQVIVADGNLEQAEAKSGASPFALPVQVDVKDHESRNALIVQSDIVISMLPPGLHPLVAENCVAAGRHLLTASYVDETIKRMEPEIRKKGLLFLCEMGLDPGIDHMSAMQLIHRIRAGGEKITSFHSHCGGLVAPESDDNPWHYKISWNPRNVVMAGKTGAVYKSNNEIRQLPYHLLFDPSRTTAIAGHGYFAWYPNRDSLAYISLYTLEDCSTFIRTTLRHPDFCTGWKKVIELNLTDEIHPYDTRELTYREFFQTHLLQHDLTGAAIGDNREKNMLAYLGFYDDEQIGNGMCTAADILQTALENKLKLKQQDRDMIIMQHELEYGTEGQRRKTISTLVVRGENSTHTAMARTVGLPLGIAATLILQGKITLAGLHIPIVPEIYTPVLAALKEEGIVFEESVSNFT